MKKERPILFSTAMVQALLAGRKTQTRRMTGLDSINEDPGYWNLFESLSVDEKGRLVFQFHSDDGRSLASIPCPYGQVGDVLWIRETFISGQKMENDEFIYDGYGNAIDHTWFRADGDLNAWFDGDTTQENIPWKPSIHMPKAAARIWLEITDIRVERVQDISEADAAAEGVDSSGDYEHTPVQAFEDLWKHINGVESWQSNSWVWVVTFRILSTTGKPETL